MQLSEGVSRVGMIERRDDTRGNCELDGRQLLHLFRPLLSSNLPEARKHGYRLP